MGYVGVIISVGFEKFHLVTGFSPFEGPYGFLQVTAKQRVLVCAAGMAPSPSLRRSPGTHPRTDSHKRGRSLERRQNNLIEKDDDLQLFTQMHRREQENFLLHSGDDLEDVFSTKSNPFLDFKLGITVPVRGEGSDLLNADEEENAYDWLLRPPETPLFRSLDDDPAPVNLVHGGRPRCRPIPMSTSSMMEDNYRSGKGSASPQQFSSSPRSGSSTVHGRPSSGLHSSPTPTLRRSTSLRRPSPTPTKPSTPPPRSATPPPRRSSLVSAAAAAAAGISIGVRGTSPVRTGRGNSASPRVRAWQSNLLGFSMEPPSNLRTSLADRPASYVRGSSPASRNSKDSSSKFGQQSISPSASRSVSSSRTHEQDRVSSCSRASPASSIDDDADSLQSIPVSSLERSVPGRLISGCSNNHPSGFSKKPTKTISSNTAPKRSFDSVMRQMDRKSPHNMFRPLLSSVPSSTFYGGKASYLHCSMASMYSSITTSSNASSDQATNAAPDTEGTGHCQDDMANECGRRAVLGTQDTIFAFDKAVGATEFTRHKPQDKMLSVDDHSGYDFQSHLRYSKEFSHQNAVITDACTSEAYYLTSHSMEVGSLGNLLLCTRCRCRYLATGTTQSDFGLCLDCQLKEENSTVQAPVMKVGFHHNSSDPLTKLSDECGRHEEVGQPMAVSQLPETVEMGKSWSSLLIASSEESVNTNLISCDEPRISCLKDSHLASVAQDSLQMLSERLVKGEYSKVSGLSDIVCQSGELQKSADDSRGKVNLAEGVGISGLLLKRSSSGKGTILQSRNITSIAVSYEDSSYTKDSTASIRSSIGYGSASTSSSVDLTLPRHAETLMQRQFGSTRSEMSSKPQISDSSYSGTSADISHVLGVSTSTSGENVEATHGHAKQISDDPQGLLPELLSASENAEFPDVEILLSRRPLPDNINLSCHTSYGERGVDTIEMSSCNVSTQSEGNSLASLPADEDRVLHEIDKQFTELDTVACMEDQDDILETSVEENTMPDDNADQMEIAKVVDDNSSAVVSEMDVDESHCSFLTSQTATAVGDDFHGSSVIFDQDEELKDSVPFSGDSGLLHEIVGESAATVEEHGNEGTRSLTLEEATDTILFCSSIIRSLAYEAATIGIEKKKENPVPSEGSAPIITLSGNRSSEHGVGVPLGRTPRERPVKSQKQKRRQVERETEPTPRNKTRANERPAESTTRIVGLQDKVEDNVDCMKPLKLESKCNCTIM